jgi:membrane protease YdiL (CAAX protease family)
MGAGLTPSHAGDARARALTLRERVADVARFAVRPTYVAQPMGWGRERALTLAAVSLLHGAVTALVLLPITWAGRAAGLLPAAEPLAMTPGALVVSFVVIAPLTEELLFRGWMSGRLAALRFALYGAAALGVLLASFLFDPAERGTFALVAVVIVFAGLFHWGLTWRRDARVPGWFVRHFGIVVWGSSLLFGLIHLGNYAGLASAFGLIVVLPQTIGGLLLAYVRTRIGLGAGILYHAAYNGLFAAAALAPA